MASLAEYRNQRSLELLLDGARWTIAIFGHWIVIWLLVWVLADVTQLWRGVAWAAAISLAIFFQACFALYWGHEKVSELNSAQVPRLLKVFTTSAWVVGLLWAMGGLVLFPENNREMQLFLVFVMGGMSLSAVGTQHVYLPACYGSMGVALPVLAARYGFDGRWVECSLLVLYTLVILRLARMLSRFSMRTISLQFERDQLLQQLTQHAADLERARDEADEANQAKSRFLAQASHDLRQPLHAMGLFVESLTDSATSGGSQVIGRMRDSIGMLSNLFDSLLDVTVLDAGNTESVERPFRLDDVFVQLERDFAPIAKAQNVQLRFVATSCVVASDPVLLRRLIQNLVSNAIRHANGGRVLVGARRRADRVTIEVCDNGAGIPEQDLERIFQEFVKLNHPESAEGAGLGLGLAIVQRLANVLGLNVQLKSKLGRGTRFFVHGVRRSQASPQSLLEEDRQASADWLVETRVLVVDDDREVLDATTRLLEQWGCTVTSMEQFPEPVPDTDVVLSDYELDGDDGLRRLIQLKQVKPDVLTVLISGNSSLELKDASGAAGIPLLHKPVRPVKLRSLLLQQATRAV